MRVGPHIEVTQEMIEAMRAAGLDAGNVWGLSDGVIVAAYRAARALEPGPHQGAPLREIVPPTLGVRRV